MLAERAFLPWTDMEDLMREENIPLYSLETKHPLTEFDILGVFLPYESIYTNVLNGLDLAGIPLTAEERTNADPLVIGGGHAAYNPEPVAPFFDAFAIGEGEEIILEIIDVHQNWKSQSSSREELHGQLAKIEGVYLPAFYQPHYHQDGSFSHLDKLHPDAPDKIKKRITPQLPPSH